ncbi:MAG: hypothetical protein JSR17_12345 [Proteobacteria bacterium]|nr:hypothetical protein [Pseudomonadota bacterium]
MLGKVLDRLDQKLYRTWEEHVDNLIKLFSEGLAQIDFKKPIPEEMSKIQYALQALKKSPLSREDKIEQFKQIQEQLEILATEKQFDNPQINNFIFQSRRTFNYLMYVLVTQYNKYAEAFLNPSRKGLEKPETGLIEHRIIGKAARGIVDYYMEYYEKEYIVLYDANVQALKKQPVLTGKPPHNMADQRSKPSLLQQKMGVENHRAAESNIQIDSPKDIPKYIAEQIYGTTFDSFYLQVAKLYEIKTKIDKLASSEDPREIEKKRKSLLQEAGLAELNTKSANDYLNNIANLLGFTDAKELYQNFQALDKPEGYALYKELKSNFMAFADKSIPAIEDPLENIKLEVARENSRLIQSTKALDIESNTYANLINFSANEIIETIKAAQRSKNVGELLVQDYFNPDKFSGVKLGFFKRKLLEYAGIGAKALLNEYDYKQYIDAVLYKISGNIKNENNLALDRLEENTLALNMQWVQAVDAKMKTHNKDREIVVSKASKETLDDSKLVTEYIQAMQVYKREFKNYNMASNLDKDNADYKSKKHTFKEAERKFNNYKDGYSILADSNIFKLDETNIDKHISERKKRIQKISVEFQKKVASLEELHQSIKKQQENRKKSVGGFFARVIDTISPFGYKSSSYKEMQATQAKIDQGYAELEPVGLALHIEKDLLIRTQKQKDMLDGFSNKPANLLTADINQLIIATKDSYDKLRIDFEAPSSKKQSRRIYEDQQAFYSLENQLANAIRILSNKLNAKDELQIFKSLSLEEITNLHENLKDLKNQSTHYQAILIGKEKVNQLLTSEIEKIQAQILTVIAEKKVIAQEKLLGNAKAQVSAAFKDFTVEKLEDPFYYIESLQQIKLSDLSNESLASLNEHIVKEAKSLLERNLDIPIKSLEKVFSTLQANHFLLQSLGQDNANIKLQKCYEDFLDVVTKRLNKELQKTTNVSVMQLMKKLPELNQEIHYLKSKLDQASHNVLDLESKIDSWLSNFFGSITKLSVLEAKGEKHAANALFALYQQSYQTTLETYAQKVIPLFEAFDYEMLIQHIEQLEASLSSLTQLGITDEKLVAIHTTLLDAAKKAEANHLRHADTTVHNELESTASKLNELHQVVDIIHNDISVHNKVNVESLNRYKQLLETLNQETAKLEQDLKELNAKNDSLTAKYEILGVTPMEDNLHRSIMAEKIIQIKLDLLNVTKRNAVTFNFYTAIAEGKPITIVDTLDQQTLSKGLLLALQQFNLAAVETLLDFSVTNGKIDSFALGRALEICAHNGDLESLKKIINYREDVEFTQDQLNTALRTAIGNQKQNVVDYLVVNIGITPDNETVDAIIKNTNTDETLSSVERGLRQLVRDDDGYTLENIRKWFSFLHQQVESLQSEAELLKQKTSKLNGTEEIPSDIKQDINAFMQKMGKISALNDSTNNLFKNTYFDTPSRKESHIKKWGKEIDDSMSKYHKMITDILNPPKLSPITEGALPKPSVLEDIAEEKAKRDAEIQLKAKQRLAQHGVIVPDTIQYTATLPGVEPANFEQKNAPGDKVVQSHRVVEAKTQMEKVKQDLDALLNKNYFHAKELIKIDVLVGDLKSLAAENGSLDADIYVQKAIYQMAKENKVDVLNILLEHANPSKLNEISANALSQAIEAGSRQAAILLFQKNAFKGHENDILEKILHILDEKKAGELRAKHTSAQEMLFELLTYANVDLIDPKTQQLDQDIIKALQNIPPTENVTYKAVSRSWGLTDNDKPKLEALRNAYLFADEAYGKLIMSTYLSVQKILEADPSDLKENDLVFLDQQLKLIENSYQRQLNLLEGLSSAYIKSLNEIPFDNLERKEGYSKEWAALLQARREKATIAIKSDITDARKILSAAQVLLVQQAGKQNPQPVQEAQTQPKRQSVLLSKGHKRKSTLSTAPTEPEKPSRRKSTKPGKDAGGG